jgi:hypothetical protein
MPARAIKALASSPNVPHTSPHVGKTPPHIHLYSVVEEKNKCNDVEMHPQEEVVWLAQASA